MPASEDVSDTLKGNGHDDAGVEDVSTECEMHSQKHNDHQPLYDVLQQ
jgi:hypothetical protein